MKRPFSILPFFIGTAICFAQGPYIDMTAGSVRIGNGAVERVLSLDPGGPGTTAIMNKLSGKRYAVHSDEFALSIVFAGFGPAVGKEQNGENPSVLTSRAFRFLGAEENRDSAGTRMLSMRYGLDGYLTRIRVTVHYAVSSTEACIRKWIEVSDSAGAMHFLDRVDIEDLAFEEGALSRGGFGQPVFIGDLFLGVEYPGVENDLRDRHMRSGYVVGEKIASVPFVSERSVLGVSASEGQMESTFLRYVETIKVRGTRPFLLYNSWYDLRHPSRTEVPGHAMTEQIALERVDEFRKNLTDKHGITLDAFVLDDGWDNVESIWRIDSTTFPRGFTPISRALQSTGTRLGLWASPFCGYDMRAKRVSWGAGHGYEHTGDFLCFAGKRYGQEFRDRMVQYTRDYGIGYFKWDGFLLACNEPDHGHLPGVYSRRALISAFANMMAAVRKVNPDIFINITVGSWLSPWWLRYADCVWMQGEDYGYAEEVPSLTPRDKAISYRDAVLWEDFQKQHLLFPVSSMMTHGIIKGRLNLLGGEDESLESFTNEVVMYFGRGVMMWELYVSPDALSTDEWHAIASCVRWARDRKVLLTSTRMIGGNPLRRESYGYVHSNGDRALVLLRNPSVQPVEMSIALDRDLGLRAASGSWHTSYLFPYHLVSARAYHHPDSLRVRLGSYDVVMIEVTPSAAVAAGTPLDVRYRGTGDSLLVYGAPGSTRTVNVAWKPGLMKISFPGESAGVKVHDGGMSATSSGGASFSADVDFPGSGGRAATYALLVEPSGRLTGKDTPAFHCEVDGIAVQPTIEQEGGKWFWARVPMTAGKHRVVISVQGTRPLKARAQAWLLWESPLQMVRIRGVANVTEPAALPSPYPPTTEKQSQLVGSYEPGMSSGR